MTRSALPTERLLSLISDHSSRFASAALGHLDVDIPSCPGWTMADLVQHVTQVQWFWSTIAAELPETPPAADDPRRPKKPTQPHVALARLTDGAARLVQVLASTDQQAECWTWTPIQQDVAFITRHQVQEIAVHHWDAAAAIGAPIAIEQDLADDAVTEFLTFSVANIDDTVPDPAPDPYPDVDGSFRLRATDTGTIWSIHPGAAPATVAFEAIPGSPSDPTPGDGEIAATASDLLLWLYHRVTPDLAGVDADLLDRFRKLSFTD